MGAVFCLGLSNKADQCAYRLAYRAGVTTSITSPSHTAWLSGISTAFSLGASHKLSRGAILRDVVAVHASLTHGNSEPSVSTKIEAMRRLLTKEVDGEIGAWFQQVANVRRSDS